MGEIATLRSQIAQWTLDQDNRTFQKLDSMSNSLLQKFGAVSSEIRTIQHLANSTHYQVNNAFNRLMQLSETKFTEHKMGPIEEQPPKQSPAVVQDDGLSVVARYQKALTIGLERLEVQSINQEDDILFDDRDDRSVSVFSSATTSGTVSKNIKLPHMYGSAQFTNSKFLGLFDEFDDDRRQSMAQAPELNQQYQQQNQNQQQQQPQAQQQQQQQQPQQQIAQQPSSQPPNNAIMVNKNAPKAPPPPPPPPPPPKMGGPGPSAPRQSQAVPPLVPIVTQRPPEPQANRSEVVEEARPSRATFQEQLAQTLGGRTAQSQQIYPQTQAPQQQPPPQQSQPQKPAYVAPTPFGQNYDRNKDNMASIFESDDDEPDNKLFQKKNTNAKKFDNLLTGEPVQQQKPAPQKLVVVDDDDDDFKPKVVAKPVQKPQKPKLFDEEEDEATLRTKADQIAQMYTSAKPAAPPKSILSQPMTQTSKPPPKKAKIFGDSDEEDDTALKAAQVAKQQQDQKEREQKLQQQRDQQQREEQQRQEQQQLLERQQQEKERQIRAQQQREQQQREQEQREQQQQKEKEEREKSQQEQLKSEDEQQSRPQSKTQFQLPKKQDDDMPVNRPSAQTKILQLQQGLGLRADMFMRPQDGMIRKPQIQKEGESDVVEQQAERPIVQKKSRQRAIKFDDEDDEDTKKPAGLFGSKAPSSILSSQKDQSFTKQESDTSNRQSLKQQDDTEEQKRLEKQEQARQLDLKKQEQERQQELQRQEQERQSQQQRQREVEQQQQQNKLEEEQRQAELQKQQTQQALPQLKKPTRDPLANPLVAQRDSGKQFEDKGLPNFINDPLGGGKKVKDQPIQIGNLPTLGSTKAPRDSISKGVQQKGNSKPQRKPIFGDDEDEEQPQGTYQAPMRPPTQTKIIYQDKDDDEEIKPPARVSQKPAVTMKAKMFDDSDDDILAKPKPIAQQQQPIQPPTRPSVQPQPQKPVVSQANTAADRNARNKRKLFDDSD